MKKIECIVSDIDYTLAVKGGQLMPLTIEALTKAHNKGIKIGLSSGREINKMLVNQDVIWGLDFKFDFIIGMNGGQVLDIKNERSYSINLMTPELMKDILNSLMLVINEYKVTVNVEGGNNFYALNINDNLLEAAHRKKVTYIESDFDTICKPGGYKFLFRYSKDSGEKIRKIINTKYSDRLQCIETFPGIVEVFEKGYDKGTGLELYAKWNDIDLNNTIAFGDNENDIPMLKKAGKAVVVSNATDITKKEADVILKYSCFEDGVGHYLLDNNLV